MRIRDDQEPRPPAARAAAAPDAAPDATAAEALLPSSGVGNQALARALGPRMPGASPFVPGIVSLAREPEGPGAGGGAPLPAGASAAGSILGPHAADVRVHRGPAADARLASRPEALAVTEGSHIHVGSSAPSLDSPEGQLLLAHEAAHVVQMKRSGPEASTDHAEAEADDVAVGAMLGRSVTPAARARGPLYFEAPKHQATLSTAMQRHGFSEQEAQAAYFGNWCRDLSQAIVPTLTDSIGKNATFQVVNLLAIRHFGHGVTPAQLGAYSPREHIDNPAGTTDRDITKAADRQIAGFGAANDPLTGTPENVAGTEDTDRLTPEKIAQSFKVDAAGVPEYINRSKDYILQEFAKAKGAGRSKAGLYHLGNFSHTVQDLFAHSNWIEMAVGHLITSSQITIPPAVDEEVKKRIREGRPPIETYAAQAVDKAGNTRPILQTGTFTGGSGTGNKSGHDTFISISEEAKNLIQELNPFEAGGEKASNWDFAMEILNHMDASAEEGQLGEIVSGVLEPVYKAIEDAAKSAGGAVDKGAAGAEKAVENAIGKGVISNLVGGAGRLASEATHAVVDPLAGMGVGAMKAGVKAAVDQFGKSGLKLAEIAIWAKQGAGKISEFWKALKDGVRKLPETVREWVLPKLVEAERNFKKEVKKLGSALYKKATEKLISKLAQAARPTQVNETNVDHKYREWAKDLSKFMKDKLKEIGGEDGARLAADVPAGESDEDIQKIIAYAETAFPDTLKRLADAAESDAVKEATKSADDTAHQLKQLANVPEWARAGASHSQINKDHAGSPFFGVAFAVANQADDMLIKVLKELWGDEKAEGLEDDYGAKDAKGEQKVDKDGRPVLAGDDGLSEWEKEARKRWIENRKEGEATLKQGVAPHPTIGGALSGMVDRLKDVVRAYPVLGPVLDGVIAAMSHEEDADKVLEAIDKAEKDFDAYAKSGRLDDEVMDEVDGVLALARPTVVRVKKALIHLEGKAHGHEGDDRHHLDDHDHEGGDVHTHEQIELLDEYRGTTKSGKAQKRADGTYKGVQVEGTIKGPGDPRRKSALDKAAEGERVPEERFKKELDRIFAHPYDSTWWVPTVKKWCGAHQDELARYIRDRNSGVSHVH